ncbi:DUF2778 domain-containing protein [Rhizobium sp. CG5]|nr:DUF2778 domain-containing protein [Rhizobium sp. CG5]
MSISAQKVPAGRSDAFLISSRVAIVDRSRSVTGIDKRQDMAALEEAKARLARAVALTDDPLLAVLPRSMNLSDVDKSQRLALASSVPNEQRIAILRQAIAAANAQATRELALAAKLATPSMAMTDPLVTASIPAKPAPASVSSVSSVALAYAAPMATDDIVPPAVDPRELPFEEVLSETDHDTEDDLLVIGPLPAARPETPKTAKPPTEKVAPPAAEQLAVARPEKSVVEEDDGWKLFGNKSKLPGKNSRIAVYDISAGVVHMPNGEKLEAHSGRGSMRDNPRYANVKNRGPTPPHIYNLRMRESRFHGVEAIRMLPYDGRNKYGRDGFLTHTYLLRVRGDSSGCVVFEEYNRFLNAFKRGEVTKMIVVPRMSELPKYMAAL